MGNLHRVLLPALIGGLLAACGRSAGDGQAQQGTAAPARADARTASSRSTAVSTDGRARSTGSKSNASLASGARGGVDPALAKDAFLLPGAIEADTGLADLRRIFGVANVKESDVPGGGDGTVRGAILFPGDPKRRAYVYFEDARAMTGLSMVCVLDQGSLWRSAQGVRVGMPLPELAALNGKPFEFFGFEGNYGGWISDWLGGRLAPVSGGMSLHVRLSHRVFPKDVPYRDLPYENFRRFRSDQPQLVRMQVVVDEITLNAPDKDDR